jgi:two-component sensor histidine kinase
MIPWILLTKKGSYTVSDNRVSVPESFDLESPEGLGLQLVTTLVDLLDGELELKRDKGTEFTIRVTLVKS